MMEKILLMLQLQQELNDATNGENWEKGVTKQGKPINWQRCIYMECAEIIDSFGWKHWKDIAKEPDWGNIQIEVVDIWHFVMSLILHQYKQDFKGSIEDIAIHISQMPSFETIKVMPTHFALEDQLMKRVESIMCEVLKEPVDSDALLQNFFILVNEAKLDEKTLYRLYVGKNILNQFRQDNGYKEGAYKKIWDGEEDNVVMKHLFEENPNMKPDQLYKALAKRYLALS